MNRVFPCLLLLSLCSHPGFAAYPEPDPLNAPLASEKPAYLDPDAPLENRVKDLVGRMTLEEKAQSLDHKGPTLQRFGLRADQWNQCLNGVKWNRPTTFFPTCIAMGATWDVPLVKEVASALSDEARAIYNGWKKNPKFQGDKKGLIYRAPVINISRNPYWGRIHEVYGEDPYLTGRMAVAYVQGLQGDDPKYLKTAATLKHFAVNNVETNRQTLDAKVPERWLREYWLPHWREAVVEGKAQSLMASYNAINGTPNNINHGLLTDLLKKEWGHEGFVVSDLGGVRTLVKGHGGDKMPYEDAVAQSVMAGCDFSDKEYAKYIPGAVMSGKISEERLNDAVSRVMRVRFKLGEFDPQERLPWSGIPMSVVGGEKNRALALKVARESIVLLQNRGGLLPLDPSKLHKVAVIGPHADRVTLNNYYDRLPEAVAPLQGLMDRLPSGCDIIHVTGSGFGSKPHPNFKTQEAPLPEVDAATELPKAVEAARKADVAIVFVGTNLTIEHEALDRTSLGLTPPQEDLVRAVAQANPKTVVVLMSAGPLAIPWLKEHVPAILQAWWPGEEGGHAIADVLMGACNPAGRLPYTMYASDEQVPARDEYDVSKGYTYMYLKGEPLYPFGHGLSYTSFRYDGLNIEQDRIPANGSVKVSCTVENTGKREGDEVVQLYVVPPATDVPMPRKELRGFRRINILPGEKREVSFEVPAAKLAIWDEKTHAFKLIPGSYGIEVGASSSDIRLRGGFQITP